jgi:hypothetical protein
LLVADLIVLCVCSQTQCRDCQVGRFMQIVGQNKCEYCLGGTYSNTEGRSQCTSCEPGKFQEIVGSTVRACGPALFSYQTATTSALTSSPCRVVSCCADVQALLGRIVPAGSSAAVVHGLQRR